MQFNPKIGFVLGILVTIETAISGGLLNLTNAIPAAYIPGVVAWSSLLAFAGSAILTGLHAYSNGQTGPMVPDTPLDTTVKATDKAIQDLGSLKSQALAGTLAQPPKVPVIALLIGGALILGLLQPGAAYAQGNRGIPVARPFTPTPGLTGNPITDIRNDIEAKKEAATGNAVETFLAKPFQALADFIGSDSDAAITLSTAIPELQDGHGQQCWLATRQFGDVVKAHPVPLTLRAQTDLQALRLLMMAANNLCSNVHCTQVFGDLANGIQQLAPLNASIPIPSLHDLCSKVPQIAVIAPVSVPTTPVVSVPPAAAQ